MKKAVLTAGDAAAGAFTFRHPLQDDAEVEITGLSRMAGMSRSGINLTRIPPGRQAFPLHRHHLEEEWVYVVSGRAEIRLDDDRHELGAGGFAAFAAGGPAHAVRNLSESEDLVCLMGGDAVKGDIVDFPEIGKRVTRSGAGIEIAAAGAFEAFDFMARSRAPGRPE